MFSEGVYLNGTVKQGIGLAPKTLEGAPPSTLMGLTVVERIEASTPGLLIEMKGRWFLIPWHKVASCEVENPFAPAPAPGQDLLGDDAALERATRPDSKPQAQRR
jgi:hypothetical protein